ncbi:MAG TPA: sporulation integral membrane protein YtvI [Clostridiales bacterium]|nr:sporulation integral membrane protein YtvI [Clostridiales bacterium]
MTIEQKRNFLINILYFVVIISMAYIFFKFLFYLLPFAIGLALAVVLQKPARKLSQKTKIPQKVCSVALVAGSFIVLSLIIVFFGYQLFIQFYNLARSLSSEDITKWLSGFNEKLSQFFNDLPEDISDMVKSMPQNAINNFTNEITNVLTKFAANIVKGAPGLLLSAVITIVASCFIAVDYDLVASFIRKQLSERHWYLLIDIKHLFLTNIAKMLRGYLLLMFITFIELSIGLIIIGKQYAVALAAIIALVDILPVLGTGTVLIPWAIFSIFTGNYFDGIALIILYLVITLVRNILEPKIIGDQIGLPPLVILISMFCGFRLFGVFGVFAFPLTLIVLNSLHENGKIRIWKTGNEG